MEEGGDKKQEGEGPYENRAGMQSPDFQHILVPLDGSAESELALAPAQKAGAANGRVTLVHVAEDLINAHQLPLGESGEKFSAQQVEPVREYLAAVATQIVRSDLKVETVVASGHPADAILDLAQELGVDAIALCNHMRSPLRRVLKGSTIQYLLAKSKVPLLVVHDEET